MEKCAGCSQLCSDGELIDGRLCFDCWLDWHNEQEVQEAMEATGLPREKAKRVAFMRSVERGRHARAW